MSAGILREVAKAMTLVARQGDVERLERQEWVIAFWQNRCTAIRQELSEHRSTAHTEDP